MRTSSTLKALSLLDEAGVIDRETADVLRDAYLFFRKTEHRIQINHQRQTHVLPKTEEEQAELARRMGYRDNALRVFLTSLEARRHLVGELFSSLFYSTDEDILPQCSSVVRMIVERIHNEDGTLRILEELRFTNPKASYPSLKGLLDPSDGWHFSQKGRHLLERLAPLLVDELLKVPEPERTLVDLDKYVASLQGRPGYLSTLLENPPTARFLVRIIGQSRFFAELLIRLPPRPLIPLSGGSLRNTQRKARRSNPSSHRGSPIAMTTRRNWTFSASSRMSRSSGSASVTSRRRLIPPRPAGSLPSWQRSAFRRSGNSDQ